MLIHPSVDVETQLICLIGDAIPDLWAEHHLCTLHVIHHHILESCLASLRVDSVEVNFIRGNYLNSYISFNKVDVAANVQNLLILCPSALTVFILLEFEKEDIRRAADDQGCIEDEVHLAHCWTWRLRQLWVGNQFSFENIIVDIVFRIKLRYDKSLSHPIEGVDLAELRVVETPLRKIPSRPTNLMRNRIPLDCFPLQTVKEMPMS